MEGQRYYIEIPFSKLINQVASTVKNKSSRPKLFLNYQLRLPNCLNIDTNKIYPSKIKIRVSLIYFKEVVNLIQKPLETQNTHCFFYMYQLKFYCKIHLQLCVSVCTQHFYEIKFILNCYHFYCYIIIVTDLDMGTLYLFYYFPFFKYFLKYFLSFQHVRVFKTLLVLFLTQLQNQLVFHGDMVHFIGERYLETKILFFSIWF